MMSCSSQAYDLPTGVGNRNVLCAGVDSFTCEDFVEIYFLFFFD